jgi:hypothetical protein
MNAAHDLLRSIRDFGWPIFVYAIFAPIPTYVFPSGRSREEKTARLLFVGTIIAAIEGLFFLGTESNDVLQVARLNPLWGVYVLILLLLAVGTGGTWAALRARENQKAISIGENAALKTATGRSYVVLCVTGCAVWVAGSIFAVFWLARIANTQ